MAKVQIRYKDRKEYVPVPSSLDELKIIVKEVFGIAKPLFQYFDEDHELITVDVQLELVEALRFVKETQGFLIVEETNLGGSSLQFIDDLPLLKSQITSEESPNVIQESQILEVCNFMQKKENVTPNGIDYFGQKKPDKFPELEGCERKNSENSLFDVIDLMGSAEEEAKVYKPEK